MILRFSPDTWRDALFRPLAMAAPDAFVYIELHAPDFRFALVLLLMLVLTALAWKKAVTVPRPLKVLTATMWLAFVPWLVTSGNGRYFIPFLLCVGVVCMALLYRLPATRGMRASLALLLLAMQAYAVFSVNQMDRWGFVKWSKAPYFEIVPTPGITDKPHTFVSITQVSYSLVAPQFHPDSRWISVSHLPDRSTNHPDYWRVQQIFKDAASLQLIVNALPGSSTPQKQPNEATRAYLNGVLAAQHLQLATNGHCSVVRSRSMALLSYDDSSLDEKKLALAGFWACPLALAPNVPFEQSLKVNDPRLNAIFQKVEQACPRLFMPGQNIAFKIDDGFRRTYTDSDMWVMVLNGIGVMYKYWHALNPVLIGTEEQVLRGDFKLDCNNIRGRSGLPWEREI